MTLTVGKKMPSGGEGAWSFGEKQFFVSREGQTTISVRFTMLLGETLTDDQKIEVHKELERQNPGREVVWPLIEE